MKKLKEVLAQEDTVLFIGSGISIWSGIPSWSGMIEELAQFVESAGANADLVRAEAKNGDLLQAASYGFDKLTKHQRGEFIRTSCRYGIAKPHEIHRKIVSLGPRCFITTNYDNLIEESVRKWVPDRFFRPVVTNRHLTETAEIVHARAIDFIFKPHGDAADSESIILTREQYRQLLPQGDRQAALESLKMLLASRPVVYFGFGLRDPDFMYVRDLLTNTFKGGTRDHHAVMADVSDAESDYWKRNYGIHLINYVTTERSDKTREHTALLNLLDTLLETATASPKLDTFNQCAADVVLALARHAAGLARTSIVDPEFQIRVHTKRGKPWEQNLYRLDKFSHYPVEKFLDSGPKHSLLIGMPGAGKTYSLRRAAARLAEQLHEVCLREPFDEKAIIVPIFADLKLYRGNLDELVSQMLPKSLPFDQVVKHYKAKIFLDSFNEMPREYLENGSYEADFLDFTKKIAETSLVIGSRTSDGLSKLDLPEYHLDQIDEETVITELNRLGIVIGGRFDREIQQLLQRPFYFHYITNGTVRLPNDAHPKDFFQIFFGNLSSAFATQFGKQFDIEKTLSLVAYDALNRGEEAFPLSALLRMLKTNLENVNLFDIDVRDIANWLVSSSILIPYTGGRIAFVHQSVTEYLAAAELARRYQARPQILKEKLSLTRWDQALFLTLSLLPPDKADTFLQDVIKADFALALSATKYLEVERDRVVSKLLAEIPKRISDSNSFDNKIEWAVEYNLPLTEAHEPNLRVLIKCGNSIGAAAASRLVEMKGESVKDELLQLLVDCSSDYNLCCNGIARALKPFAKAEDAKKIVIWADQMGPEWNEGDAHGFTSGAAAFLVGLDLSIIRKEFIPYEKPLDISEIRAEILCRILDRHRSTAALDFAGELLLRGVDRAGVVIYFIANFTKPEHELSWASFTIDHILRLEAILNDSKETWGLNALRCLCAGRQDLAEVVKQRALLKSGIEKAAMLYCVSPTDMGPIFQALGELVEMSKEERHKQPIQILHRIDFDWTKKEDLFVQLLKLRDTELARALFGGSSMPDVPNLGNLDIEPIDWWLEWMIDVMRSGSRGESNWLLNQLGGLFAWHLSREVQESFVAEFNQVDSKYRGVLLGFVLPQFNNITIEAFNEDAISFMLADLSRKNNISSFRRHLLGQVATEQFIIERLLPLLPNAKQPLLKNLHKVLKQAGSRHGRRYIIE